MILTRSPYYLTIPLVSPLTSATSTEYTIAIYVWQGEEGTPPGTATYTITRENYEGGTGSEDIDIARIVDGELARTLTTITGGNVNQTEECQAWVKTEVYYTTGNPSDDDVAQLASTKLAVRGYGYGMSGKNPDSPDVMLAGDIFRVSKGSKFILPIDLTNVVTSTTVTGESLPNGDISIDQTYYTTSETDGAIKYLVVDTSDLTSDVRIPLSVDSTIKATLLIDYDDRYTNTDVIFFNRYGAQQSLSMRKAKVESMAVTGETYESSALQPLDGEHQFVEYNLNAKTSVKMSSGYIPQSSNEAFKQLLLSDRIWLLTDGVYTPATIRGKKITYKTRANDSVVNYDIDFEHAFYEINNV